jgi:hypothetical protein
MKKIGLELEYRPEDNLPSVEERTKNRTADGKFGSERQREAKAVAAKLLDDPEYQTNLLDRLRAGEAGNIEMLLWRYRFGDPPKAENEEAKHMLKRIEESRQKLVAFMRDHPEAAKVLDAKVVKRKTLPFPGVTDEQTG